MTATPNGRSRTRLLPELELEVMKVLWEKQNATVAEVQTALRPARPLAYTTVMTVLDRLSRKEVVTRSKRGRGYVYRPSLSREAMRSLALDRLLHDFFGDSAKRLADYLRRQQIDTGRETHAAAPVGSTPHQLDSALL